MGDFLRIRPTDLIFNKKQYSAPVKLSLVAWNPGMDLLAVASKRGDIVVKRPGWKKCWKVTVTQVIDQLSDADANAGRSVECLTWSPEGDVLAVGMDDGHIHLLDVNQGEVRWSKRLPGDSPSISRLQWFNFKEDLPETPPYDEDEETDLLANFTKINDDYMKEMVDLEKLFLDSLRGTLLFAIRADNKISILAGGICPIAEIDIMESMMGLQLYPVFVYDVLYSADIGGISVVVTSQGPRPHCGGAGTFGVPVTPPGAPVGVHTHVVNMKLDVRGGKHMWSLVERYLKVYNRCRHMISTIETETKEWDTQSQIFVNRFLPTTRNLDLGETFISYLLTGVGSNLADAYIERSIQQGIKPMGEFLDTNFANLIKSLRTEVSASIRSLAFQLEQFRMELENFMLSEVDNQSVMFPKKNTDVAVYPYNSRMTDFLTKLPQEEVESVLALMGLMEDLATRLQTAVNRAVLGATANLRELQLLIRWLSTFPAAIRNVKKVNASNYNAKKVNFEKLLRYLIDSFVQNDDLRAELSKYAYDPMASISEMDDIIDDVLDSFMTATPAESSSNDPGLETAIEAMDVSAPIDSSPPDSPTPSVPNPPNLVKVKAFWSESLTDEALKLLGYDLDVPPSNIEDIRNCTLLSTHSQTRNLLNSVSKVIGQLGSVKDINWLAEVTSEEGHCGYNGLTISRWNWSKSEETTKLYQLYSEPLKEAFVVLAHSADQAVMKTILPRDCAHFYSGIQDDMTVVLKKSSKFVEVVSSRYPSGSSMQIEMPTEFEGAVDGIVDAQLGRDGFFYVLMKSNADSPGGETRRLVKGHPLLEECKMNQPYRVEQVDSLHLAPDNRGCFIYDGGMRIALFTTSPADVSDSTDAKRNECEEYRRLAEERDKAKKPAEPAYFHIYDGNRVLEVQADE